MVKNDTVWGTYLGATITESGLVGRPATLFAIEPECFGTNTVLKICQPRRSYVDEWSDGAYGNTHCNKDKDGVYLTMAHTQQEVTC